MIVQMSHIKNELDILEPMFKVWQNYADAFVFMDDGSTDGTYEYLKDNASKYNILSVMRTSYKPNDIDFFESISRQQMFDEAIKYSGNIICLDADEYLDGTLCKKDLEAILEENKDTLFYSNWIQYTDTNQIRVDGKWNYHPVDRIGSYTKRELYEKKQTHGEHVPKPQKQLYFNYPSIFVSHLHWLAEKKSLAVKQYHYKVWDYVLHKEHGVDIVDPVEYDKSVNNFNWTCVDFPFELKVPRNIYEIRDKNIEKRLSYKYIKENIKRHNVPNLNDWGFNLHEI